MAEILERVSLWSVPVLLAVVFHEVAHGAVAYRLGDPTAARAGRLTLNPLAHVDPIGTVAVPLFLLLSGSGFLFGWAKPVPVDTASLRRPRRDAVLVAAAGPAANLALAVLFSWAARVLAGFADAEGGLAAAIGQPLARMAHHAVVMNVFLGVFNLLPIPPLDGGRVVSGLLPLRWSQPFARIEPFGFAILLLLMMTSGLGIVVGPPVRALLELLLPVRS